MTPPLTRKQKTMLISVFILGAFMIGFQFTSTPRVWVDEGVFTEAAKNLAWHGTLGLQTEPGTFFSMRSFLLTTSYPVIFPVAMSLNLFGAGVWQARLPMIFYMFVLMILFYVFAKKRYGFTPATLSVLMLISFAPFFGNGRPVQGEVPGLVFIVLGAWFVLLWEESSFKSPKWAFLGGLALGLAASVKPIFLLGVSLALVSSAFFWFKKIENKKTLLILGAGFILPIILWGLVHFPTKQSLVEFIPRFLYFSGSHESGIPLSQTIATNLLKFFTESTPMLFLLLFLSVIFALAYKLYKKEGSNISISESLILFFVIFNWLGFLIGTGWYRYFFPAHVLLYLLFPAAVLVLAGTQVNKFFRRLFFAIPVTLVILQLFHLIFLSDTSFVIKRTENSELSAALSKVGPDQKILFYSVPEAAIFLKSDNYYQYLYMGFMEAGDKNVLTKPSFDLILTSRDPATTSLLADCFDAKPVSQYLLFQRKDKCK